MSESESAANRLDQISNLPTIPGILVEILGSLQDPNIGFDSLKKIVYKDPPLAARILRIANSAYFGRSNPTNSLETAFLTIGINELIMIISSIGVVNSFAQFGNRSFDRRILWKHSLMTGLVARYISQKLNLGQRTNNDEFIAGLLHDLGHIIISHYFPKEFVRIQDSAKQGLDPLEIERSELGNDHSEISALIATRWRFSETLVNILRFHHTPEQFPGDRTLVRLIHFSDRICSWRPSDEKPIPVENLILDPELLKIAFPDAIPERLIQYSLAIRELPKEMERFNDLASTMDIS